jgi:hypothetical protein
MNIGKDLHDLIPLDHIPLPHLRGVIIAGYKNEKGNKKYRKKFHHSPKIIKWKVDEAGGGFFRGFFLVGET